MNTITRETKNYYTVYVAEDGTEFSSQEECKKYEQTADAVVRKQFKNIFGFDVFGTDDHNFGTHLYKLPAYMYMCSESKLIAIRPKNADELEILNRTLNQLTTSEVLGLEHIGKTLLFEQTEYDDGFYFIGEADDFIERVKQSIDIVIEASKLSEEDK